MIKTCARDQKAAHAEGMWMRRECEGIWFVCVCVCVWGGGYVKLCARMVAIWEPLCVIAVSKEQKVVESRHTGCTVSRNDQAHLHSPIFGESVRLGNSLGHRAIAYVLWYSIVQ